MLTGPKPIIIYTNYDWFDLDLFYGKVKFGHLSFYMGKMKIIYVSKTIAPYDLKVVRCIELNDLMNLHESRSFSDLLKMSLGFQS